MIPRIIHYCWFGGGPMPEAHQRYVDGWKNHFQDYEIIRWDESNSPIHLPYMQKALAHRKWANLSNYTRLHALYEHGGIYLDTDIEVLKTFDELLTNECFVGFENNKIDWASCVNNAVMGAVPRHTFVSELKDQLLAHYDGVESANLSSPDLTTALLKKKGLNSYKAQWIGNVHIYPKEYFYPYAWYEIYSSDCIMEQTYCIHHWQKSWAPECNHHMAISPGESSFTKRIVNRLKRLLR